MLPGPTMPKLQVTFFRHRTRPGILAVSPVSTNLVFLAPDDWESGQQEVIDPDLASPGSEVTVWLGAFRRLGYSSSSRSMENHVRRQPRLGNNRSLIVKIGISLAHPSRAPPEARGPIYNQQHGSECNPRFFRHQCSPLFRNICPEWLLGRAPGY